MGKRSLANGVVFAVAIIAVVGCGEPFSLLTGSTGGSGGAGGGGASSGATSSGASSGSGVPLCTPGDLSKCDPGSYCKAGDMPSCALCSDLSVLKFGKPKKIELTLPANGSAPRYPRIGPNNQLLFSFTSQFNGPDLGHAKANGSLASLPWTTGETEVSPINTSAEDSASFFLPKGYGSTLEGVADGSLQKNDDVIVYQNNSQGTMKVVAYNPGRTNPTVASLVLQGGGDTNGNMTISYMASTRRLFYMSNANGPLFSFVNAVPGSPPDNVSIHDNNNCELKGNISPWVTPDGKALFFSTKQLDKNCMPGTGSDPYRSYYAPLNDKGQQAGTAVLLDFVDDAQGQATPSLSPDLCMILFTKQFETASSAIYAAIRE